jgi:LasA protease
MKRVKRTAWLCLVTILVTSCVREAPNSAAVWQLSGSPKGTAFTTDPAVTISLPVVTTGSQTGGVTPTPFVPPTRPAGVVVPTPTPNPPKQVPTARTQPEQYTVLTGDTLGKIATRSQVSLNAMIKANPTINPNLLYVGTVLTIPAPEPGDAGSDFKIIPDSELVYGPHAAGFDLAKFIKDQGGYLARYTETYDDVSSTGTEIVQRVTDEYSVNPRLLLAVLEYTSGWVTGPADTTGDFPIGPREEWRKGLYHQLAFAADNLNKGFYQWEANSISVWSLADGEVIPIAPTINAGTAGIQSFFASIYGRDDWKKTVSADGFVKTYIKLFGDPFDMGFEPLIPADLQQPTLQLPFENSDAWSFTGGPHGGYGEGSAWAAIDFAPPGDQLGCYVSTAWVVALAPGIITRGGDGEVIEDLDGDGLEETGWTILYMHVATQDRVAAGTHIQAGDHIGHASCEGGVSEGTHTHIARRYNGVWIAADGSIPMVLDGWVTSGDGIEYDGFLTRNGQSIEAWDGRTTANQIQR